MLVRAKETCVVNSSRVRAGMVFEYALEEGGSLPSYLVPAGDPVAPPPPPPDVIAGKKAKYPKTIHEHAEAVRSK